MERRWIQSLRLIAAIALFAPALAFAGAGITYHGRLLKPDGTAVTANPVKFKIQLRSPGSENCLMYQETHAVDMSTSEGVFAVTVNDGTATVVNTEPFSLDRVFQNRGTFTFAGGKCALGNTYVPQATDGRKIVVEFDDGLTGGWEPLPAQAINFVPMALESLTLNGYGSGSMLRVHDGTGAPAAISALTQTQYNTFIDLLSGSSSLYLTSSSAVNGSNLADGSVTDAKLASGITGSKISGNISGNAAGFTGSLNGDVTGTQSATVVAKLRGRDIDTAVPTNGQVLKWNNGNSRWEPSADNIGTGTVTSVTGTGAVQMTGTAADPIVGVRDASTTVKGVVQLASSADTTANLVVQANDTRLSDSRAPTAHHHVVDEIDSAASKYFGYKPNNTACANGEFLKWNLAQTRWECGTAATGSSESTTASNVGSAGVGVFKQLSTYDLQLKKLNPAGAVTITDDTGNSKIDIGLNLSGVFTNNTGLIVSDGTQLQNKACSANQVLKWLSPTGWTCAADDGLTSESDPKVGANTANYLSKWNGTALIASGVFDNGTNVGIGTNNPGSSLTVNGPGGTVGGPATLAITPNTDGANVWATSAFGSAVTAGHGVLSLIGQAASVNNSGYVGFRYTGAGSANNYMTIGMFGNDNILNVTGAGNVGIGTTTPGEKLEVNGAVKIGASAATADGTIRWTGTDFEGRKAGSWVSMTSGGSSGAGLIDGLISMTGSLSTSSACSTYVDVSESAKSITIPSSASYVINWHLGYYVNVGSGGQARVCVGATCGGDVKFYSNEGGSHKFVSGSWMPNLSAGTATLKLQVCANGASVYRDSNDSVSWVIHSVGGSGGGGSADNLGNHTATQNLNLGSNYLSPDGTAKGIRLDSSGNVGIGSATPATTLDVNGTMKLAKNASAPYSCDAAHDGALAMTSIYTTCACKNGTGWVSTVDGAATCAWSALTIVTNASSHNWSDGSYAQSCNGYRNPSGGGKTYSGSTGDGIYKIDPDGAGSIAAFDVYCDMTTSGGGWTLVAKILGGSTPSGTADVSLSNLQNTSVTINAKMADASINAMPWTQWWYDGVGDSTRQLKSPAGTQFSVSWAADYSTLTTGSTVNGRNLTWAFNGGSSANVGDTNTVGVAPHWPNGGGFYKFSDGGSIAFCTVFNSDSGCSAVATRAWVK